MKRASLSRGLRFRWTCIIIAAGATVCPADSIQLIDPVTGRDSGWQASFFPESTLVSLVVDAVTDDAVFIQKFVDFDQPVGPAGLFSALNIDFTQTLSDGETVPNIVIVDEGLTNLTGADWNGFNWRLINMGEAWFDRPRSAGFSTDPLSDQTYGGYLDGDPDRPTILSATGGVVRHLESYFPGAGAGELWINVDLSLQPITSFLLQEKPVPEPCTLGLLGLAALVRWRRRAKTA